MAPGVEILQDSDPPRFTACLADFSASLHPSHIIRNPDQDLAYEAQEGVRDVLAAVRSGAPVVFVSGRAGTGKSRLIHYLEKIGGLNAQAVVAPTGIAALALGAGTIHGVFRLPLGVLDARHLPDASFLRSPLKALNRLIVDEVSMVRADILDAIDVRLREVRGSSVPFGGVQIVMIGDFLQLPPVVRDEDRVLLGRLGYDTPFAFSAKALQTVEIRVAVLKKVWRQNDPEFVDMLSNVRSGRKTLETVNWFNTKCARPHREGRTPLVLTATRRAADRYNEEGLAVLRKKTPSAPLFISRARMDGTFARDGAPCPAPPELSLVPGMRVMAIKNDPKGRFANGSLGVVRSICLDEDHKIDVRVLFDGENEPVRVAESDWAQSQQVWNSDRRVIDQMPVGTFSQLPLVPGYAITIHKAQGLSLSDVRIDLGRGAFAPGQLYVALSRARSVEGLSLARKLSAEDVRVDDMLIKFLEWADSASNLAFE